MSRLQSLYVLFDLVLVFVLAVVSSSTNAVATVVKRTLVFGKEVEAGFILLCHTW